MREPEQRDDVVRPLAILDVDGVVADVRHRLHHVATTPRQWAAFFAAAGDDPLLGAGAALARELADGHEIVYLTGRPERLREVTATWLARHDLPAGRLLMRSDRDRRPAAVVKSALLADLARELAPGREIRLVVDDDPEVVAALGRAGYPVRLARFHPE